MLYHLPHTWFDKAACSVNPPVHFHSSSWQRASHSRQSKVDATWKFNIYLATYSPPTLTGAGHQWTFPINTGYIQWLSLAKSTLNVGHVGKTVYWWPAPVSVGGLLVARNHNSGSGFCCATLIIIFSVTYYIKLHNALIFNVCVYIYIYRPIKLKLVVWTLRNMNIFP